MLTVSPVPYLTPTTLACALLNLPLASADVLGTFTGVVRQAVQPLLMQGEAEGWIQSLHPSCLGRSRQRVYALTAQGLRRWYPYRPELLHLASTWQLDPVGLVAHHLPRVLRRQTAYRVASHIFAQARADHPRVPLTWTVSLDRSYEHTVPYVATHRGSPTTRRIVVPSDLLLEVAIGEGKATTWERAQVWLYDGMLTLPRLQARLQTLHDAFAHATDHTPQTFIIVRDLARLGLWQTALDAVLTLGGGLPGALCLVPVPWPWPLTCGGQPAPARPWKEQWVQMSRAGSMGMNLPPLEADRWRARPVLAPLFSTAPSRHKHEPAATLARRLPAWREALLTDPAAGGTIAAARTVLARRRTQVAERVTLITRFCLDEPPQALVVLACIAVMPLVTRTDLAHLLQVPRQTIALLLAPLHGAGLVAYLTPSATSASLPPLSGATTVAEDGVRLTEMGQRLLAAFYPQTLAVYRRATRLPRAHDSGVARFFTLFEGWLRTLAGVGTLWWWTGPTIRLRAFHKRRRSTAYPDATGCCVVEGRTPRSDPRLRMQIFLLEWDMGHERRAAWEAKAAKYIRWILARLRSDGVLTGDTHAGWYLTLFVVAPTARQATMIAEVLTDVWATLPRRAEIRCRAYVTTFTQLGAAPFAAIWTTIGAMAPDEPFFIDPAQLSAATSGGVAWPPTLLSRWSVEYLDAKYARQQANLAALREHWRREHSGGR